MVVSIVLFAILIDSSCASLSLQKALIIGDSSISNIANGNTSSANIAFDLPDLTVALPTTYGVYHLEAYRSTSNDAILKDGIGNRTSELYWVSIGMPEFIRLADLNNPEVTRMFHPTRYGFTAYIEMMTDEQRQILVSTANAKYRVKITANQIVNLILATFQCTLTMYDDFGNAYLLTGVVSDLHSFPLRMDFKALRGSAERKLFSDLISDNYTLEGLRFECTLKSTGKNLITNTLSINSQMQQTIGLDEKLFGKADNSSGSVFVTRDQTSMLSSEMYSSLNIIEDYEIPQHEFSEAFVEGLINQLATDNFKQVDVDIVLGAISKYGFDISADIKPDIIKKDAGSILKIEQYNNKSHIVLDQNSYNKYVSKYSDSGSTSVEGCAIVFCFSGAHDYAKANGEQSSSSSHSLSDQLKELNSASRNEAKWDFEGEKIVPKSFNVARMSRTNIKQTLTFSRVRIQKTAAAFDHRVTLYAPKPSDTDAFVDQLSSRLDQAQTDIDKQLSDIKKRTATDCADLRADGVTTSGVYTLYNGQRVYCDMTTDGGGWTVFQRRLDGTETFYRNWDAYANGFGNISHEFWFGNDNLYALTRTKQYKLRVDLADFNGNTSYAEYSNFIVGPSTDKYRLVSLGNYSGNAGDSLTHHSNMMFTTFDQDNDLATDNSAVRYRGAWWYKNKDPQSNLNGHYYPGGSHSPYGDGVDWSSWTGLQYSMRVAEMKIKPNNV